MSYAGPASRSRGSARRPAASATTPTRSIAAAPANGHPASGEADEGYHETDWQQVAIFGAGLALGLALGAGTALLTAPQSGEETRAALRGRAKRIGRSTSRRGRDAWAELRDELQSATMSLRRRRLGLILLVVVVGALATNHELVLLGGLRLVVARRVHAREVEMMD